MTNSSVQTRTVVTLSLLLAALTIGPAILYGKYTDRWGESSKHLTAAVSIEGFPSQIGEWVSVENGPELSLNAKQELGVSNYISRVYKNPNSNRIALLLLLVGDAGPLVRHPPEICYGNRANKLKDSSQIEVGTDEGREGSVFRVLSYDASSQLSPPFRVAYAWSDGGPWRVPQYPRLAFGGKPVLYKLQIQVFETGLEASKAEGELKSLLESFSATFAAFQ